MTECSQSQFPFEAHFSRQVMGRFDGSQLTTDGGGLLLRQADRKTGLLQRVTACFTDHRRLERDHRAAGGEEHAEPDGAHAGRLCARRALSQDHLLGRGYRRAAGRDLPGSAQETTHGDRAGSGRHRHAAAWAAGGALLPRLLQPLLLPAAVCLLRRPPLVRAAAAVQPGPQRGQPRGSRTDRRADSQAVAEGADRAARGLGLLSGGADGMVRDARRGLCIRLRAQPAATAQDRPRHAGSQAGAPPHGEASARVHRVLLSHAGQLVAGAARGGQGRADRRQGKSALRRHSLAPEQGPAQRLYEQLYCARGEMENRIKEQLSLFSDRLSTETLRANQLRLYFSSLAYVLVHALRRIGLRGTEWAEAQAETIRLKLLKIAARVRVTARRIWVCYSGAYPWKHLFTAAWSALRC